MNYRPLRVANLIRDELSQLILREMEFSGALVTVTEVVVDKKLEGAAVKVSILPSGKALDALRALKNNEKRLQRELGRKLNIRPMPKIHFELDRGPEKAAGVEKLLLGG